MMGLIRRSAWVRITPHDKSDSRASTAPSVALERPGVTNHPAKLVHSE